MEIFNYKKNKNLFLYSYIILAFLIIILKIIFGFINEDVISDVFFITVKNLIFASVVYVDSYCNISIDSVGTIPILLLLHFGILLRKYLINIFVKMNNKLITKISFVFVPVLGIVMYIIFKIILNANMPFCLLEAVLLATITYPLILIENKIQIPEKICSIINMLIIMFIAISTFLYMFTEVSLF